MSAALSRRQFLGVSAGAALAELLAAPRTPVRAQGLTTLNVGMGFHNLDSVPAWIAQDKHFFERFGLSINIVEFQGGARSITALAAGEVPISLNGGIEIVNARSKGVPVQMIAGIVNKFSFDFVVAKNITSPSQLRGAKGAISSFGGSSDFAARYALAKLGINLQDVTLLQTGAETSRLQALSTGQIQFTVLTAGLDLVAFDLGFKPLLKLYTLDQPFPNSAINVNTTWAKTHPTVVDAFMKAIVAANVFVENPLNLAAVLALLHTHLPIKEDHLRQGFKLYRGFYSIYPYPTVPGLEFLLRERKIDQPATDFYDSSYIQALQNANFAATVAKTI